MYQKVKGTYDLLPEDSKKWEYVENKLREIFRRYNFLEIRTPIMEYSEVIHRENEFSDMVQKETYNFKDKGNRDITLRPEQTAGVIRSYVENKLYATNDLFKVFYIGSYYRYERPQKGRYREFFQFGVEAVGQKNPYLDAEIIALAYDIVKEFGLKDVKVKINSLGDNETRKNYQEALVKYFKKNIDSLCKDCHERIDINPLRILDCKVDSGKKVLNEAPKSIDYLTPASRERFETVLKALDEMDIDYEIDSNLVRGLDYYTETVFEIHSNIKDFNTANTLGGGGVYDNLVKDLGGPDLSGVGFAFGLERFISVLEHENLLPNLDNQLDAYIIPFSNELRLRSTKILKDLRDNYLNCEMAIEEKSFKAKFRQALKKNPRFIIFIGEDEIEQGALSVKNTKTEHQEDVKLKDLVKYIKEN